MRIPQSPRARQVLDWWPMTPDEFESIAVEEYARVPERLKERVRNVALLIEDESRRGELLGLYEGVPLTARGNEAPLMPDRITLFMLPILREARTLWRGSGGAPFPAYVRDVVRDTLWHEIAHHFGMEEEAVGRREENGTNEFRT